MAESDSELVHAALEVIADPETQDEADMIHALVGRGVDPRSANRLVALVPLAFGRVLISHIAKLDLSTEFIVKNGDQETVRSLNDEPLFLEALRVAMATFHSGPRDLFEPAATFSAEFNAVNRALNEEVSLDGGSLERPVFSDFAGAGWIEGAS